MGPSGAGKSTLMVRTFACEHMGSVPAAAALCTFSKSRSDVACRPLDKQFEHSRAHD